MVPEFRDKHRKTWNLPKNILLVGTEARRQNISQLILGLAIPLAHCALSKLIVCQALMNCTPLATSLHLVGSNSLPHCARCSFAHVNCGGGRAQTRQE